MEQVAVEKKFGKYVMSSMITMFLQGAYSVIDGLFVSNLISDTALSAVNVAWPVIAVINAVGTGVGCGGAVLMSTKQGEGKQEESNVVRANVILALLVSGIVVVALFLLMLTPLLRLMGAEGELLALAEIYGKIMIGGGLIQIFACGLTPLLRNDNRAVSAMVIMVGGLVMNLVVDFLFIYVFHLGIAGAAAASVTAQLFTTVACFLILIMKKNDPLRLSQFKIKKEYWGKIFKTAVSPFGISLTPSLLILYHNMACLRTGSEMVVNAYALISSTVGSYRILLIGVAEGIQPLASYAYGARDFRAMRSIRNKGIVTAIGVSVALFLFTIATAGFYPDIYGYSGENAQYAYHAVMVTAAQLIFTGLVRVTNSYFYAVGKDKYSLFMIYFDPLVMTPITILILPMLLGVDGIWLTAVVTQLILNVVAVGMFLKHEKEMQKMEQLKKTE